MFGYMDIQWGQREDNAEILGNKGFEGLSTIANLEKKVWGQESKCFIDLKEEARWICFTIASWFW